MQGLGKFPPILNRYGRHPEAPSDLTYEEARRAFDLVRAGAASRAQTGAFLMAQRTKGTTAQELRAAVDVWQEDLVRLDLTGPALQVSSGFGGQIKTIGLALPASLVAAAAGARVLLMGADSMPPTYGITPGDILRAMGIKTALVRGEVEASLATIGWAYGHFPNLHPRFQKLQPIRRELGIGTVLDQVEQLLSPVGHRFMLVSTDSYHQGTVIAEVLRALHVERGAVVLGEENSTDLPLDHVATTWRIREGVALERTFNPREHSLEPKSLPGPHGLTLRELARMYEEILSGQPHPYRQAVQLNAAHCIYTAGIAVDFPDALRRADEALLYGTAYRKLREFRSSFALK
ncbi:MAG TPA: hypothetical protein VEI97_07790 [bacterium]|nr:hypothetical protein [bacterium]